ncbi:MAG: substrate-binding domain-containing protein, partial [Pseudomonadota bacterium]
VILLRKGNPQNIKSVADLLSDNVTLTCSNPVTEKASFSVYHEALQQMAVKAAVDQQALLNKLSVAGPNTVHSRIIHHREVPELIGSGRADAAIIYYHLALRYTRVFPDLFELLDISEVLSESPNCKDPTTRYHIGMIGDGGMWGSRFVDFMREDTAQSKYVEHGLVRLH